MLLNVKYGSKKRKRPSNNTRLPTLATSIDPIEPNLKVLEGLPIRTEEVPVRLPEVIVRTLHRLPLHGIHDFNDPKIKPESHNSDMNSRFVPFILSFFLLWLSLEFSLMRMHAPLSITLYHSSTPFVIL